MNTYFRSAVRSGTAFALTLALWNCGGAKIIPASARSSQTGNRPETPIASPYSLKKGDELVIKNRSWASSLIAEPETQRPYPLNDLPVKINEQGEIALPGIGFIKIEGLTRRQLSDTLSSLYGQTIRLPVFEVRVTSHRVKVLGSVVTQGIVSLDSDSGTLADILSRSGGIDYTEAGNTIRIIRREGGRQKVMSYTFREPGDPSILYQPVFDDDIVYIPPSRKALRSAESKRNYFITQPVLTSLNLAVMALNIIRLIR